MATIPKAFGTGGSGLVPGWGNPDALTVLNEIADDLNNLNSGVGSAPALAGATVGAALASLAGFSVAPAATTVGAALGAFTDPPSAAEMANLRARGNAIKADLAAIRTAIPGAPAATVGADLPAYTDPPTAGEMATTRTFLNALIVDDNALRAFLPIAAPANVTDSPLGAYTDPPNAGEMAATRTLVNDLRTSDLKLNSTGATFGTTLTRANQIRADLADVRAKYTLVETGVSGAVVITTQRA